MHRQMFQTRLIRMNIMNTVTYKLLPTSCPPTVSNRPFQCMHLRCDGRGVRVRGRAGSRIFSSPRCPDRLWGPSSLLSNGHLWLFPRGVKRQGCEADHSPLIGAEVKKMWLYTSSPPDVFME
jgi:hypothetical protein